MSPLGDAEVCVSSAGNIYINGDLKIGHIVVTHLG